MTASSKPTIQPQTASTSKKERLAKALKANLMRRKKPSSRKPG
jgi:hypothetical protein